MPFDTFFLSIWLQKGLFKTADPWVDQSQAQGPGEVYESISCDASVTSTDGHKERRIIKGKP